MDHLRKLTDSQLISTLKNMVQKERDLLTQILHHLMEVERRRLFSESGHASLFDYCVRELGYSEASAQRRISAMRLLKEIPQVEKKINDGTLSLSNVSVAQSFFKQEEKINSQRISKEQKLQVLEKLENKSAREGQKLLLEQSSSPQKHYKEKTRVVTEQLTEIRFAVDEKLMEKINLVKGLMAAKNPNVSYKELMEAMCDLAIKKLTPKAPTEKDLEKAQEPQPNPNETKRPVSTSKVPTKTFRKAISAAVKRIVWHRDGGKCQQCGSRHRLQFEHKVPVSHGGGNNINNITLLCQSCNARSAINVLGMKKMDPFLNGKLQS